MTQQALPPNRSEMALASRQRQLLVIMVLSIICCAAALGATSPMTASDRTADLQSLEVPVSELTALAVGHVVADPDNQDATSIDVLPAQGQSEGLTLDLAPRVANILQDVFSAVVIETPSSDSADQPLPVPISPKSELSLSPVAGDASQTDSPELADPDSGIENMDTAPSIQREMFRTDI